MEFDAYGGSIEERELDFEIPLPDPASQTITTVVCAICKNEKPYILEWVAHQKLSGFDQIFVYDNDSDDGTAEALIRLHNA
ncbi:MAG: glycosyltransferase family 2 protein, partial [Pseudomonas umsongensis]|nr:glycosyltransferase family 2 protein [Pseudomonas umsongensis]